MISSEVWNCCLGIIKLSIGIDTSAAIFGIMRFNETKELRFKIVGVTQKEEYRIRDALLFAFSGVFTTSTPSPRLRGLWVRSPATSGSSRNLCSERFAVRFKPNRGSQTGQFTALNILPNTMLLWQ